MLEVLKKHVMKQVRCYNYTGNDMYLRVYMRLADWSKRELDDIEPAIVAKYQLWCKDGVGTKKLEDDTLPEATRHAKLFDDIMMQTRVVGV